MPRVYRCMNILRFPWFTGLCVLACVLPASSQAQEIPSEYTGVYQSTQTLLENYTANVNAGWNGARSDVQFCGELYPATSLSNPPSSDLQSTIIPYINALQAEGVRTVKFSINFPVLYEPYYDSASGANNPAAYQQTLGFYQSIMTELRARGMKVIIPTQVVFPYEYTTTTPYFQTLTLAQYTAARSAMAQTIASVLKPDYLIVQSEPVTEVANLPSSLGSQLAVTATDLNMVSTILTDLQNAGLRSASLLVGAGMGTWQPDFDDFLNAFVALPMDLLSVHVYPVNDRTVNGQNVDFLGRILQMADAAHAHGLKVGMSECWPYKESDSELSVNTSDQTIQSRNVYSFWAPLDAMFLEAMAKTAYWKDFEFLNPFWSLYYFAYLDYDTEQPLIAGMSAADAASFLETQENKAAFSAVQQGSTTATGALYSQIAAGDVHPPFFNGESALENGVYYLQLPSGNPFGYYSYLTPDPTYFYHFDLGYEYWFDAADGQGGIYLYDFASDTFFYTSPAFPFPYLFDFKLNAVLYYYPDTANLGHYTSNPRYFYDFGTGGIITK